MFRTKRCGFAIAAVLAMAAVLFSCGRDEDGGAAKSEKATPVTLRIGYRASLPADIGPLWAHEAGALKNAGINSEVKGFGPPAALLQALKTGDVDLVSVMPLEPVLEDIRKGEANYLIFCLQCFSPTDEFDAVVVRRPEAGKTASWAALSGQTLGVIPAKQNNLVGQAMVASAGVKMDVRPFNPVNPLLSLESKDFGAVHVLGADVARAKADKEKYAILEACAACNRVFKGKMTPAGVGLLRKEWLEKNPKGARELLTIVLEYSRKSRTPPGDPQLRAMLGMQKYGAFGPAVAENLVYAPLIPYNEVKPEHFEPLMTFLKANGVEVPPVETILGYLYAR
jgi:ABC-type nitrate/sulfonate/bicarbonate transport system substrate-binding protein